MVVLHGLLRVEHDGGFVDVRAGEAIVTHAGERIRYSTPGEGAEYIAVCLRSLRKRCTATRARVHGAPRGLARQAPSLEIGHYRGRFSMGRIVVTEYIVDGVVEAPSGTEEFERVGWTDPFSQGPEGEQFKLDETMASDALLLGRITYDGFAPSGRTSRGIRGQVQLDEVRRLLDPRDPGVEQHDRAPRRRGRGGDEAQAALRG